MLPKENTAILFHEEQRFRQPSLWLLLVGIALFFAYILFSVFHDPKASRSLIILLPASLFIIGTMFFFFLMRLETQVTLDGLYYRFYPLNQSFHKVSFENATNIQAVTYRPLRDYGGWGIRYTSKGNAYNVSGNRGLRIDYADGSHLLIGSQRADELAEIIHANLLN